MRKLVCLKIRADKSRKKGERKRTDVLQEGVVLEGECLSGHALSGPPKSLSRFRCTEKNRWRKKRRE